MDTTRYFPHSYPANAHTRCNTFVASYEYFLARCLFTGFTARGRGFAARTSRRRALSRDQPVTATTSSNNWPRSFFDARTYPLAYFAVISARTVIDNSLPIPEHHHYAGILT